MSGTSLRLRCCRSAYTLVEAVIVAAVIGILLMIAVPNFLGASQRSKITRVKSDFRTLTMAIETYTVDYDQPPIAPANYRGDTTPGVVRRVTNTIEAFTPLTTPLPYILSVSGPAPKFADPFRGSTKTQRPGAKSHGFLFINFTTGVNAINTKTWGGQPMTLDEFYPGFGSSIALKTSPVQFFFNGETTRDMIHTDNRFPTSWVLVSNGPSREDHDTAADGKAVFPWEIWIGPGAGSRAWEFYTVSGAAGLWDPSNGTNSRGHIWRFSNIPIR